MFIIPNPKIDKEATFFLFSLSAKNPPHNDTNKVGAVLQAKTIPSSEYSWALAKNNTKNRVNRFDPKVMKKCAKESTHIVFGRLDMGTLFIFCLFLVESKV